MLHNLCKLWLRLNGEKSCALFGVFWPSACCGVSSLISRHIDFSVDVIIRISGLEGYPYDPCIVAVDAIGMRLPSHSRGHPPRRLLCEDRRPPGTRCVTSCPMEGAC